MKPIVLALPALLASAAFADTGVVEATGAFTFPGSGSPSYVSAIGAGQNPRLNGCDFGSINTLTGQSLQLWNWYFENYAYNGGGTPSGALTNNNWLDGSNVAALLLTISTNGNVISNQKLQLAQTGSAGNNRFWQLNGAAQGTNLAAGLANGTYTVQFTNVYDVNQWTGSVSQFNAYTSPSTASFTVIPAPGAAALVGLAGLITARRRK